MLVRVGYNTWVNVNDVTAVAIRRPPGLGEVGAEIHIRGSSRTILTNRSADDVVKKFQEALEEMGQNHD